MDRIRIDNLKVYAYHGVFDFEQDKGQNFYINAVLYLPLQRSGLTDCLDASVSYAEVVELMADFMQNNRYQLIETVAEQMTLTLFRKFPLVQEIEMEIRKPEAPIDATFDSVSVCIHRKRNQAVIAFGSNLGKSEETIALAIKEMEQDACCLVKQVSEIRKTSPYGGVEQPDFYNGVLLLETLYEPLELLHFLQKIELAHGRTREIHWGPRTLDLDIIFYNQEIIDLPELTVPHPLMEERDFVLVPMEEIVPCYRHPITKKTVRQMVQEIQTHYIKA